MVILIPRKIETMNEKRDRRVVNVQARARKERREEMREPQRGVVAIMLALCVCVSVFALLTNGSTLLYLYNGTSL